MGNQMECGAVERVPNENYYDLKKKGIKMTELKIAGALAVLFALSAPANAQSGLVAPTL